MKNKQTIYRIFVNFEQMCKKNLNSIMTDGFAIQFLTLNVLGGGGEAMS